MDARLSAEAAEALIGLGASDHIVPELVEEAHANGKEGRKGGVSPCRRMKIHEQWELGKGVESKKETASERATSAVSMAMPYVWSCLVLSVLSVSSASSSASRWRARASGAMAEGGNRVFIYSREESCRASREEDDPSLLPV
jgi:hypothetical protein